MKTFKLYWVPSPAPYDWHACQCMISLINTMMHILHCMMYKDLVTSQL